MVNALKVTSVTSVPTMDAKNVNGEFGGNFANGFGEGSAASFFKVLVT